jgi:hypothetical protein
LSSLARRKKSRVAGATDFVARAHSWTHVPARAALTGTPARPDSICHLFLPRFQVAPSACALHPCTPWLFVSRLSAGQRNAKIAVFGLKIFIGNK